MNRGENLRPGPHNDLTDVPGVRVGHYQRRGRGWLTGTTVVLPPSGTTGSVDVGGGAPGTRETDALDPINLVEQVDAVCLTGGSAYGLAAADGVVRWLADHHRGFRVGPDDHHVVPIVPAAVLFDLGAGGRFHNTPDATFGNRATAAARTTKLDQGTVGAGTGTHAARLKGGVGSASVVLDTGITVAALAAVNCGGNVFDVRTGELFGINRGLGEEFAHVRTPSRKEITGYDAGPPSIRPLNTTLAVIATDATLTKSECARVAISGQDGLARAVNPAHQCLDGDVVFALATGDRLLAGEPEEGLIRPSSARPLLLDAILAAGADCVCRAIVHATIAATSAGGMTSYLDRFPSARVH